MVQAAFRKTQHREPKPTGLGPEQAKYETDLRGDAGDALKFVN